ncbi:UvrD-helicase domain-containing protein, partial [Alicyclobacillus sendaiensis]|uniref:UvrD-helicase domain-containing protein n=1 Tax=Alicyclobacillus sendaiensis TaxID=192387 RepID=UPI0026F465BA
MWTEEQWAVIEPKSASSVVVAAPGSGKTTVMTEHLAHVIELCPISCVKRVPAENMKS